jgi:AraC-like DNA-binding protein
MVVPRRFLMRGKQPAFRNHLFSVAATELVLHQNLMTCVIFACENPVLVANESVSLEAGIICIQPGILHRVVVREGGANIVYLDGVQLRKAHVPFKRIDERWRDVPKGFEDGVQKRITDFRHEIAQKRPAPDPKVMAIVERIYEAPFERMSQDELSDRLGLERTMALRHFSAATGQTFRKFKIWAGIVAAARDAHQGQKIGLAGIDAGFSDASHMARIAKEVFGVTPTKGLGGLINMQTLGIGS